MQYPNDNHIPEDVRLYLQQTEKYLNVLLHLAESPSQEFIVAHLNAMHNLLLVESELYFEGLRREAETTGYFYEYD